jgi:hypothetical protein
MMKEPQCSLSRLLPDVKLLGPQFAPPSYFSREFQCSDSLLMISTLIHHVVSIRIGHRLSLKLFFFFFHIEVVNDLFNVSFQLGFYLGEELKGILFLLVLLLWRPVDER